MACLSALALSSVLLLCMNSVSSSAFLDNSPLNQQIWDVESLAQNLAEHVFAQSGSKEKDQITSLIGQPGAASFAQYSGYISVDPAGNRNLFYYFVEAVSDPSSKPLVWWSNGGPGSSSFGIGGLQEHGPFHVHPNGETLVENPHSWNNVANMLYVESPIGVGFSYSTNQSDYDSLGDDMTAIDNYRFLVNWLERFPEYKSHDLYLAGQNYAGFVMPQLAELIMFYNAKTENAINIKGIILGNPSLDNLEDARGRFAFHAGHGILSDQMVRFVDKRCNCGRCSNSTKCRRALAISRPVSFTYNVEDIYSLPCQVPEYLDGFADPAILYNCRVNWTMGYLNLPQVQSALHVNVDAFLSPWIQLNSDIKNSYVQKVESSLPILKNVMANGLPIWIYSGDFDSRNPFTSTVYSLRNLNLTVETAWRAWYGNIPTELAGYVVQYERNLTFFTVRGAGHSVVYKQPVNGLLMFTSIIQGKQLPYSTVFIQG